MATGEANGASIAAQSPKGSLSHETLSHVPVMAGAVRVLPSQQNAVASLCLLHPGTLSEEWATPGLPPILEILALWGNGKTHPLEREVNTQVSEAAPVPPGPWAG